MLYDYNTKYAMGLSLLKYNKRSAVPARCTTRSLSIPIIESSKIPHMRLSAAYQAQHQLFTVMVGFHSDTLLYKIYLQCQSSLVISIIYLLFLFALYRIDSQPRNLPFYHVCMAQF